MSTTALQVIETSSGKVVSTIDVSGKGERAVDRCEMGLLRQMNLDRYHVARVEMVAKEGGAVGDGGQNG